MAEEKVIVENISRSAVGYQPESNRGVTRTWAKAGVKKSIPVEEVKEILGMPGGYTLFTRYLLIHDDELRRELELIEDDYIVMNDAELEKLLTGNPAKLKEALPKLYKETAERLAEKAVEMKVNNMTTLSMIKEASGIDVFKLMNPENDKVKSI
jgi:hypothetical protein